MPDDPHLDPAMAAYAEEQLERFRQDPNAVPPGFREWFSNVPDTGHPVGSAPRMPPGRLFQGSATPCPDVDMLVLQDRVDQLVRSFRVRGHLVAELDPLGAPRPEQPELDPAFYGLTEADLDREFSTRTVGGPERLTLRRILERLRNTYCRSIGVQFMHIGNLGLKTWLQERMEGTENRLALTHDEQVRILTRLADAEIFEDFVHKKFLGAKRFSLEGAETLIPLLDLAFEHAGEQGIDEIVIGMPHRGRLNVLANLMGKRPRQIFREFQDRGDRGRPGGDVKYHLGFGSDWITTKGRRLHLALAFNPSHLEFVNPVVMGRTRSRQDRVGDTWRARGMALLIHGDASFAGEGVVQETLNMCQLDGYTVGGVLHVIVNNQIGFTTPPEEARSTPYATAVARMLDIPVFHVNGEDPEAVAQVVRLAMDFRRAYQRDVVIDMYCYRKRGHNEGDEPAFTQPVMVQAIARRPTVREAYTERLLALGEISRQQADEIAARRRAEFDAELAATDEVPDDQEPTPARGAWAGLVGGPEAGVPDPETAVDRARLQSVLESLGTVPAGFQPHPKLLKWLAGRGEMARGERPIDWAAAEALAWGTLALEGHRVRLSGQDVQRGTFSHRHAVLHDARDGRKYVPLQHLARGQAPVELRNSPLSESGVLGFEYGYSLDQPNTLVIWEAQFGDFLNVAQVYVDQFLASAETKWGRLSGLVLLLPHGLEGQGPEHSSARIERILALAVDDNLQLVHPTTPAQFFHVLRRQVVRPWRKPLFVMTPKSMLRHPDMASPLDELARGRFLRILGDTLPPDRPVSRVLLCSGKVYFDLARARQASDRSDVAILRLEQLAPLAPAEILAALAPYAEGTPVVWVQEEPFNMGARRHVRELLEGEVAARHPLGWIARPASSSPATGSHAAHQREQDELVARALDEAVPGAGGVA